MEGRSTDLKAEREKGEIKHEATASPPSITPLEDSEPPPLEEVSEPHSKASTPPLSSPLSEDLDKANSPASYTNKGYSPSSYTGRAHSPSSDPEIAHSPPSYIADIQGKREEDYSTSAQANSPASYTNKGYSPSSYTGRAHSPSSDPEIAHSPPSYRADIQGKREEDYSTSAQNEPSPKHAFNDNTHTKTRIGSNTSTVPIEKVDARRSIRSSIPSITQSVASAAKHVSFTTRSFSSRSSSAIYGAKSWWKGTAHQMRIVEVALRFGGAILALITFSVMAATSERRTGAGSTFTMKFTDYQAYNYLVAVNVISFVYSCWRTVMLLGQSRNDGFFSTLRDYALFTYICDQVLAFLLFSAATAAATAAQLSRHGLHNIWPPACSTWSLWLFCAKADAAVVMCFFSSFFVISSSVFSGYHVSNSLSE